MGALEVIDNPARAVGRAIVADNYLVGKIHPLHQNAVYGLRDELFMIVGRN
jgi:hypothetical protein